MEIRYCIEYINPQHPLRSDGSLNIRYDRVLTLEQAEHDLTLILSFGAKILNLYMGNVVDGKTGDEGVLGGNLPGNLAGECGVCIHHQQGVFKFVNGGIFMDNLLVLLVNYLFEHIGLHVRIDDAFCLFDDEVGVFDAEIVHLLLQDGDFRFVQLLSDQG